MQWSHIPAAALVASAALLLQGCQHQGGVPEAAPSASGTQTTSKTPPSGPVGRLGSFLVLGDWGWDPAIHGAIKNVDCQQTIANAMAAKVRELGDVKFVVNVGDSFYPNGVASKSDPQWEQKWRAIYPKEVRSVPWYSVYGNHDYPLDPCACSDRLEDCAQINDNVSDLSYFVMPNFSYSIEHPELDLEVIGLDMNYYTWVEHTCRWSPCEAQCRANLKVRHDDAFDLFYERAATSTAANLVVFSHYPTDYFWAFPEFLTELSNASSHHVEFFGGHRHNVDQRSTTSIAPNNNWVVGGGGGWGCEGYGNEQGFVVGEIGADRSLRTYSVLVNYSVCCSDKD